MSDLFASAVLGHTLGDYLFQNDWMAREKKCSDAVCLLHAVIWTFCVCAFGHIGLVGAVILLAAHFAQDRWNFIPWYMRNVGQQHFLTGPCTPWSIIVVDNVFHVLTIWIVIRIGL